MTRLMDDVDLAKTVLNGFLEDIPKQILVLKSFMEARDGLNAERQVHSIKGASATVGGEQLCAVALEMEKAANAGDLTAAGGLMTELEAQFEKLKEAIGTRNMQTMKRITG